MTTTPPPTSLRARTPPTPLHGPQYDSYEPYSPRRSKRSTAQRNPYHSRSPHSPNNELSFKRATTPPPTAKKTRFTRTATQLSSPPSSPASPQKHLTPQRSRPTPRKQLFSARRGAGSDSDHASSSLLQPAHIDPTTMLPTPSKTPRKRQAAALNSSARILNFQAADPNDLMPTPRKVRKHGRLHSLNGFDIASDHEEESGISIFTDANARVPEVDETVDNPFVGPKKTASKTGAKGKRRMKAADGIEDTQMEEASRNDEGIVYVFRGKKIFRRFEATTPSESSEISEQRSIKRKAGASAARPFTRSTVKPRLLFPSEEQLRERDARAEEEAVTDIEMHLDDAAPKDEELVTPVQERFRPSTPPPTNRTTRSAGKKTSPVPPTPVIEDAFDGVSASGETFPAGKKGRSPFDSWQRTKGSKKREGGPVEGGAGGGKRTRSNVGAVLD